MTTVTHATGAIDRNDPTSVIEDRESRDTGIGALRFPSNEHAESAEHTMVITIKRNVTEGLGLTAAAVAIRDQLNASGLLTAGGFEIFKNAVIGSARPGGGPIQDEITRYVRELYDELQTEDGTQRLRASLLAQYQQVNGSITLYMPPTSVYTNAIEFEDVSLTNIAKGRLMDVVGFIPGAARLAANQFVEVGTEIIQNIQQLKGLPINPKVEILFSDIPQRGFQFDFLFSPTSAQESNTIKTIIQTLREESAPEEIGAAGIIWKSPSVFNIAFYHNGAENRNIPRIQECVLEKIDVDYAPTGHWATFKNGYPVVTRLALQFREREPNHRHFIEIGY